MAGMSTDLELVRQVLARELDTISQYEKASEQAQSELIRSFFRHLADEEKEHVAEAYKLLLQLDPAQRAHFDTVDVRPEHFGGSPAAPTPAETPAPRSHGFTVGSLKRGKDAP